MPHRVRYLHVGGCEGVASVWGPGVTGSGAGAGHQVNSGQVSGVTSGSWSRCQGAQCALVPPARKDYTITMVSGKQHH